MPKINFNPLSGKFDYTENDHTKLKNIGTNSHAQIDTHIGSTSNPHSVTHSQLSDKGVNDHATIDLDLARLANTSGTNTGDQDLSGLVTKATLGNKGSLISATAAATPVDVGVGTNGQVLMADSSQASGLKWEDVSGVAHATGEVPGGLVNSSNTTFTLATIPITGSVRLYLNGVRLKITEDYTISGNSITMNLAPVTGDLLLADYYTSTGTFATGSTSFEWNEVPGGDVNGSNTVFTTAHAYVAGSLLVFRDGQKMKPSVDYTETTNTSFTFVEAPLTGSEMEVSYQSAVSAAGNADTLDGLHGSSYATITGVETLLNKSLTNPQINQFSDSSGLGAGYSSWTLTPINLTLGNATVTARYKKIGKLVHCVVRIILGSTSSVSGSIQINLPLVATNASYPTRLGVASILDSGTIDYDGVVVGNGSTHCYVFCHATSGTYLSAVALTPTVPMTWAVNDQITMNFTYEAA